MSKIKVMLVDDHNLVRLGIRELLEKAPDIGVVGEANSGEAALKVVRDLDPDVVLMDLSMPNGMNGIEATRRMVRLLPDVKVIALTVMEEEPFPTRLRDAGAKGYMTKGDEPEEMLDGIRRVYRGEPFVASRVAVKQALSRWNQAPESCLQSLSKREAEVMMMILDGRKAVEIAEILSLSTKTVSTYRQRIFEKLAVHNDVELTLFALRHGLIKNVA